MTNKEWLYSLEPHDLAAWFDAEHDDGTVASGLAVALANVTVERDELQEAYDEVAGIAADLCRACGFSMVDAAGEVVA